jgi:hypothetical protein
MREADIIRATLTDRVTVFRADAADPFAPAQVVYETIPCALSRTAKVSAPDPADLNGALAECCFRVTLFLPAGTHIRAGDRAEVTRLDSRFFGVLSPGMPYPSHTVAVMEVWEVTQV